MSGAPTDHRPPTSADVARHAGVSRTTVSYVMNGVLDRGISPQTVARVRSVARQLGYVPHASAQSLRAGHSTVVLIVPPAAPPGPVIHEMLGQMQAALRELGYLAVVYADGTVSASKAAEAWASLRPVGAVVWEDRLTAEALEVFRRASQATVVVVASKPSSLVPTLVINREDVGICAAEYLASKGHRRLAGIVPCEPALVEAGLQRFAGVERVSRQLGLQVWREDLAFDEDAAARLVTSWRGPRAPTAVFAYNDDYAMLLMRALQDAGVAIPDDVAVIGVDDLPFCTLLRPRLTSVRHLRGDSIRLGAEALHALIQGRSAEHLPVNMVVPHLVVRESA